MKLASAYAVLLALAVACMAAMMLLMPGRFELAGILIVLLGLPWTLVFVGLVMAFHSSSAWLIVLACVAGCAANGWLLHRFDNRRARKH